MNAFKRIFALILTLCMVLSYVPVSANAATTLTGTPTVPAGVSDATEPFPLSLMTQHGNSGGHFRIPAIVTLKDGTLVAAADARWVTWDTQDDNGNIDTVVSYSKDNGDTWEVTFANYFTSDTPFVEDWGSPTIIDPGIVTDGEKVYMIADLFPGQTDGAGNCNSNSTSAAAYDDQGRMLLRENASTTDTSYYLGAYTEDGKTYYNIYPVGSTTAVDGYVVDAYFNLYQDNTYVRNLFEYSTDSFIPVMTPHLYLTVGTFDANGVLTWSEPTMLNPALRTNANDSYYLVSPGRGIKTKDDVLVIGAYGNATGEKASIIFYDGENWHRSTSSASSTSSENEIVELYDGTLRMFVRHADSTYAVQYIDWTPVYDADGNVTDYTPGTAVTTAAAAHNNTNITALSYSRTSDGKQVILVACPGSTAGAWERYNGKIFTFLVDPETNAMTLANTYEVNGASDPYSYSCLTELADGTVGLLYEKGDGGNITYAEFAAEEITGLTFDENTNIFVDGSNNADSVAVTVVESSGVTHIHTESTTVDSLTDTHVAYNIVCCTDAEDACTADINCTNTYTGKATVSIPLNGTFAEDANLKGFVVNADGSITDIFLVERNTQLDTLTFEVPHFSVVGVTLVADDDIVYTSEVDLTVKIGQTITIADDTGNYEASYAAAGLDDSIAAVEVSGTDTIVKTRSDAVTAIESGKSYLITTKSNQSPLTATSYSSTALKIDATAEDLWKFTGSGTSYQISQGSNYLNISSSAVTTSTTAQDLTVVYDEATGTWSIAYVNGSTNNYLNNYGQSNTNAGVWTGLDDGSRWIIYELLSNTVGSTDITITGKSADVTSVVVGTTKYNITVVDEAVEVTLGVGETKTENLTGVAVNGDNSADTDSTAIATVSWAGTAAATVLSDGTEVSLESCLFTFTKSGDNYVISGTTSDGTTVYLNHYSTTTNEIPLTTESNTVAISAGTGDQAEMFRLISQVDSTSSQGSNARTLHFHMEATTPYWNRCGNASHAACHEYLYRPVQDGETSSTEIPGYVRITTVDEIQDGGQYLIAAKNNAGNWYVLNPANSTTKEDYVAQVGGGTTTITIEGVATGVTRVDVGGTIYKITVGDVEYVNLYANQSVTDTIEGVAYTQADVSEIDTNVATVTVGNTTYSLGEEVTDLANLSDGLYVLVSDRNNKLMTNEAVSDDLGLVDYTNSPAAAAVWRITKVAGDNQEEFYVQDLAGNYLTIVANSAYVGTDTSNIALWYETNYSSWTIRPMSGNIFLGDSGGTGVQADGWASDTAYQDDSRHWSIYKAIPTTEVTIKGVAKGETTALVGYTRYNITVEKLVVDVTVKVGETVTHTIVGEAYSDSDVTTTPDTSKVTMTVTPHAQANWNTPVASIRSGAKYLIVVNNRTAGNNATNNVLTPDAVTDTNYLALSGDYETSDVYWIIEEVPGEDDTYYVKTADGNYLTIGSGSAGTVAGETKLTLKYTATDSGGYWMLGQGSQYLNQYGGVGNDYAAGYGSQTDTNSQWELFEYIEEDYTDVTFSGLTVGDTTAVVGYTNYNIHVVENVVDVSLYVGETVTETINGVSLADGNNYAQDSWNIAAVSWADGSERTVTAELLDTSGTATGTIDLAAAEYTFTRNDDGTYTIKDSTDTYYLNVTGIPHGTTEAALDLTMNSDGTVNFNVSDDTSKYLCVYRSGQYSMCWSSGKALDEYPDDCAFYIYAPVAAGEASSAEIPGYKKVTSLDDITSGEGYLIAFEGADGNVYCVCFTSTGTSAYNNMARIETELVSSATAVTITGRNVGTTSVTVGGTVYNITVLPHVKTLTIEIGTSVTTPVTGTVTDDDITAFNTAHSGTVTVARDGDNLVFNGVAEGKAEYVLGNRKYIISVTPDLADTDDSDYVGGESGTQGEGQMITGLIISTNTSYDLNLADDVTGTITWESSDTSIFTVDENGTVTTTGTAGEAYVTVYVDGVVYQTIPVKVLAVNNDDTDNLRVIDVYNEEVLNCTAYYSYQAGALAEFPQGYQIYIKHNKSETDLITFFATPNDGYALTYIYDTAGTYFHTVSNENHSDYTTDGTHSDSLGMVTGGYQSLHDQLIGYAVNNAGAATADQIHAMLADAVLYRVDGAFFHSYSVNNGTLDANTHFVAEKLPEVTKTINGVLGASGMQVDWKPYVEGMYAEVGEYVYFTINITIDAPIEWEVDSSGNAVTDEYGPLAALEYNFSEGDPDAMLTDNLEGAYFYTKELDGQDGDQSGNGVADDDGYIADPSLQKTQQAVTAEMNRGWTAEEIAAGQRVLEYYVVYEIQPEDDGQTITNMVDLSYIYRTTYSYGATQATGHAEASMNILGLPMGDVVVDFGLPVTITGVNAGHLANQFDEAATNAAVGSCNYGYVTITDNNDGTWSVTYMPTEVFQGYDVVYLMGADGNLKNYFRVRPASTVYYEESFAEYTDGSADTGWTGEDAAVAGEQQFQEAAQTGKNNFGFDDKYAAETGMSNGTAAVSPDGASGNTATFTFTGSGFDLYANTDTTTGIVSVLLYRVTGTDDAQTETLTKFYQVVTANKSGDTTATDGQDVATNSLPIVSVTDLEHGTYKVVIKPSRSGGEFRLDGFRVYNTLADSDAYYPVDEQNVTFTELRDEVLTALTVDETTTAAQVYSASQTTSGGTVLYLTEDTDSDLLENGPKNELWLSYSETLAFTLGTGVNYAQLGLKAPNGEVTCVVTTTYGDKTVTETYTIKSSTDMFYDIPSYTTSTTETTTGDDGSTTVTTTDVTTVSGATVTIQVTSGMLSVTKLKTSASEATTTVTTTTTSDGTASTNTTTNIPAYSGPVFASALSQTGEEQIVAVLNVLYGTDDTTNDGTTNDGTTDDGTTDDNTGDNTVESNVTRIYGENRFETSFKVADELKTLLELEKFDTIIIASGTNFADALSGSFLAAKMNAPILLAYNEEYDQLTADYIHANLSEGGTVYILGGTAAVSATMEAKLEGLNVKRLAGANRFETNILILKEAGTHVDQAMLVCTGTNFADSLSASATGAPILLVWNESGELLDCQKEFLAEHTEYSGARFRIVGGNDAVSREMEKLFQSYGTTERIYGENRFETSAALAELYFGDKVENAVLAYAWNYPDGLCGGPLAHAWGAPLILTMTGYEDAAVAYATENGIVSGIILGGDGLISDEAVRDIYAMDPDGEIIVK